MISHFFLDCEFADPPGDGFGIEFISIGLVGMPKMGSTVVGDADLSTAKEFYGVSDAFDDARHAGSWLHDNVVNKLPPRVERQPLSAIRDGLLGVFEPSERAEIWARNGAYDFFVLCRIFGGQLAFKDALRKAHGIRKVSFRDTKEMLAKVPPFVVMPVQERGTEHVAIHDARHERASYLVARRAVST